MAKQAKFVSADLLDEFVRVDVDYWNARIRHRAARRATAAAEREEMVLEGDLNRLTKRIAEAAGVDVNKGL